uniref:Uncharacterized protein n=1 Tax=Strongyloides papillosus TaxID=174720 RepID=A0A0N5CGH5_STREA
MHSMKYLAILILLIVQYSFQESSVENSSSSDDNEVVTPSLEEKSLPDALSLVDNDETGAYGLKNNVEENGREKNKKSLFGKSFTNSHFMKKLKTRSNKAGKTLKKSFKKMGGFFNKGKDALKKLIKKGKASSSSSSSSDSSEEINNREKRFLVIVEDIKY